MAYSTSKPKIETPKNGFAIRVVFLNNSKWCQAWCRSHQVAPLFVNNKFDFTKRTHSFFYPSPRYMPRGCFVGLDDVMAMANVNRTTTYVNRQLLVKWLLNLNRSLLEGTTFCRVTSSVIKKSACWQREMTSKCQCL